MLLKKSKEGAWNPSTARPAQTIWFKEMNVLFFSVSPDGAISVMLNNLALTGLQNWLTTLSHTQEGMQFQDLQTEILIGLIIVTEYLNNQDVV